MVLRSVAMGVKKPFGLVAKLATNLFLGVSVSMFSMPVTTKSDIEIFTWL
jgi:hypothetical protein